MKETYQAEMKAIIVKMICEDITHYISGEEMKSMGESVCDRRIVQVLENLKGRVENAG